MDHHRSPGRLCLWSMPSCECVRARCLCVCVVGVRVRVCACVRVRVCACVYVLKVLWDWEVNQPEACCRSYIFWSGEMDGLAGPSARLSLATYLVLLADLGRASSKTSLQPPFSPPLFCYGGMLRPVPVLEVWVCVTWSPNSPRVTECQLLRYSWEWF